MAGGEVNLQNRAIELLRALKSARNEMLFTNKSDLSGYRKASLNWDDAERELVKTLHSIPPEIP